MKRSARTDSAHELEELRQQLAEAQATLTAIRSGEVDAVVVEGIGGPRVYTLDTAEFDYRRLIESMSEGAVVLTRDAVIVYANGYFARLVGRELSTIVGTSFNDLLAPADLPGVSRLLRSTARSGSTAEVLLQREAAAPMPARISVCPLDGEKSRSSSIGMVVSDLTEFRRREDVLKRFSQGLLQTQEAERLRAATELGENITQLLSSILVRCQHLTDRLPAYEHALRAEAVEFSNLLSSTAKDVQRIAVDLRPHGLGILGLVPALRSVVAEFADRTGVSVSLDCAKMTAQLPSAVELALYRVLQEALSNVEKHARASHVKVTLKRRGSAALLTIKDDGISFDTRAQPAKGLQSGQFGLLGMRERIAAVGGSLKVISAAGAGTEVRSSVPLPAETPSVRGRSSAARGLRVGRAES
jgi:PAS domain S-box-containing protein